MSPRLRTGRTSVVILEESTALGLTQPNFTTSAQARSPAQAPIELSTTVCLRIIAAMKKFLSEYLAIAVFVLVFVISKKTGHAEQAMYWATAGCMPFAALQLFLNWRQEGRISPMVGLSCGLLLVFGALTLILHDKRFIQIKPTVVYWLFSLILIGLRLRGKNGIELLMSALARAPAHLWARLNTATVLFFAALGAVNLYVALHYSEDTWVQFKGSTLIITLIYTVGLVACLYPYLIQPETAAPGSDQESPPSA